ncbi:MAG: MBL fold metallo-hydrolase [Bryobacteraceae bacterium]
MQLSLILRATALSIALGGLWIALTQQPPAEPLTVEKMADDLHVIVGSGGNVAVLTTGDGILLVDDKFERNVPEILAKVKAISDKPIRYILNTHQHGDHTGGNQKLMENAQIFIHKNARANMVKVSQPGLPQITFANETAVYLGGKEVQAHHYGRGHTNGDSVIYFPAHRVLHTGDLFVNGAPLIDYANGGSGVAWTATLDEALKLDFDRVIPGHGPIMKRADLIAWKTSFEKVRERITKLKRDGKDAKTAAAQLKMDDLPGWSGASRFWSERSFPGLYQELAK